MAATKPVMKMPELLVFAKMFATGFVGAEVWRFAFYLGSSFARTVSLVHPLVTAPLILFVLLVCLAYAERRGVRASMMRVGRSVRFDLLSAVIIGLWANDLASPWLVNFHTAIQSADPHWALALSVLVSGVMLSALIRQWREPNRDVPQLYFLVDDQIEEEKEDLLTSKGQATAFAETVLASSAHSGLVFGVDGPWGIGKSSFISIAQRHWEAADDRVIVCRFEPLRYASEPDLADRMIRELCATIQSQVFAPEFRAVASRYTRLIKGKAEVSFLGKVCINHGSLCLPPTSPAETISA